MLKARYQLLPVHHDHNWLENSLNELADDGWLICTVIKRNSQEFIVMQKLIGDEDEVQMKAVRSGDQIRILQRLPDGREVELGLVGSEAFASV